MNSFFSFQYVLISLIDSLVVIFFLFFGLSEDFTFIFFVNFILGTFQFIPALFLIFFKEFQVKKFYIYLVLSFITIFAHSSNIPLNEYSTFVMIFAFILAQFYIYVLYSIEKTINEKQDNHFW
jgi:hypothetical protein